MLHYLSRPRPTWIQIIRSGMPEFRVIRRPIPITNSDGSKKVYEVGETISVSAFPHRTRVRQFYEAKLIEPIDWPMSDRERAVAAQAKERSTAIQKPALSPRSRRSYVPTGVSTAALSAAKEV